MHNEVTLGDVTITRFVEMAGPFTPLQFFFPTVPLEDWEAESAEMGPGHFAPSSEMLEVAMQTWVVRSEGKVILIDTGVGNDKARPAVEPWDHLHTDFLARIAAAGFKPEDVDLVINTHLHVDHVGWNTVLRDGEWQPAFPNATYLMPRLDFEYYNPDNNPKVSETNNQNVFEDSVAPVFAAGLVTLWEDSYRIDSALSLEASPGHSPGSGIVRLSSGSDRAVFAGDVMHSPIQVSHADHNSCFCEDPTTAIETRRRVLARAADEKELVIPAHFSGHGAVEVERRGDGFGISGWAGFVVP